MLFVLMYGPGGHHFAFVSHVMTLPQCVGISRRKAVWGPKRTLAAVAFLVLGLAPGAFAEGNHHRAARKAQAGRPNTHVRNYKIYGQWTLRAGNPLSSHKSKVIVELQPGAQLPA